MNLTDKDKEIVFLLENFKEFLNEHISLNQLKIKVNYITTDLQNYLDNINNLYYNNKNNIISNSGRDYKMNLGSEATEIIKKYSILKDDIFMDSLYKDTLFKDFIERHFHYLIDNPYHENDKSYHDYFITFCIRKGIQLKSLKVTSFKYLHNHNLLKDSHIIQYFDPLFNEKKVDEKRIKWINFVEKFQCYNDHDYDILCIYIKKIYGYDIYEKFINTVRLTEKYMYNMGLGHKFFNEELKYLQKGNSHLKFLDDCKYKEQDIHIYLDNNKNFYNLCYGEFMICHDPKLKSACKNLTNICALHKKEDYLNFVEQEKTKKVLEYWGINYSNLSLEYISILDYYVNKYGKKDRIYDKLEEIHKDKEALRSLNCYKYYIDIFKSVNMLKNNAFFGSKKQSRFLEAKNKKISVIIDNSNGKDENILIKTTKENIVNILNKYYAIKRNPLLLNKNNIIILKYNKESYDLILDIVEKL